MTEAPPSPASPDDRATEDAVAQARRRIVARGDAVASAATSRAIRRLEDGAGADLDPESRAVVHDLGASLAASLLAVPLGRLADAEDESVDEEVIETALELVGTDETQSP